MFFAREAYPAWHNTPRARQRKRLPVLKYGLLVKIIDLQSRFQCSWQNARGAAWSAPIRVGLVVSFEQWLWFLASTLATVSQLISELALYTWSIIYNNYKEI